MTEQQTLEQIQHVLGKLENLQSEMAGLRSELAPLERSIAETLTATVAEKAEAVVAGVLHPLSQKLDEQPWNAVYSLNEKFEVLRTDIYSLSEKFETVQADIYTLNEKLDILVNAMSLTEGVYGHVSNEIDRLDGYLNYHVDRLRQVIAHGEDRADGAKGDPS